MKSDFGESRPQGRPNTIRNLIMNAMNSATSIGHNNQNNHQIVQVNNTSTSAAMDEETMVRQVNLAAAFHDHISCTKLPRAEMCKAGAGISSLIGSPSDHLYASDTSNRPDFDSTDDKEQVKKLKDMILVQLDLIQHQQEQLLKKDRQLQGLKQDREALCLRLEKMEKRITFLTSKLIPLSPSSNQETCHKNAKDSDTNDSVDQFCSTYADKSSTKTLSSHSMNNCSGNASMSANDMNHLKSHSVNTHPDPRNQNSNSVRKKCKRSSDGSGKHFQRKKSRYSKPNYENSITLSSFISSKKDAQATAASIDSKAKNNQFDRKRKTSSVKSIKDEESSNDNNSITTKNCIESINDIIFTSQSYDVFTTRDNIIHELINCDLENAIDSIEVPSWRVQPVTSCYSLEGTEVCLNLIYTVL